jgi:internalin A
MARRADLLDRDAPVGHLVRAAPKQAFVSYAWGDDTAEGRTRDAAVEGLCTHAEARGVTVLRDTNVTRSGQKLSDFMKRLGRGDRVYILMSDKYLRSTYCMTELLEVWRNARMDDAEFRRRTRTFVLPCARIRTLSDRMDYAVHWDELYQSIEAKIRRNGSRALGSEGALQHQMTARIATETADLLSLVTNVLTPADFDAFLTYGFSDMVEGQ